MPRPSYIELFVEPSIPLIYLGCSGSVSGKDLMGANQLTPVEQTRIAGVNIIIDLSLVSELGIEPDDIKHVIRMNQAELAGGRALEKTAIIGRHLYDLDFFTMTGIVLENIVPIRLGVFLSLQEAVEWLGISDAYAQIDAIQRAFRRRAQGSQPGQE